MKNRLLRAKQNFNRYYASFDGLTGHQKENFQLKYEHSLRVADLCAVISDKLELSEEDKCMAIIIGLFHDIGRFKQMMEYNTFNDAKSVDHAQLSVEVLMNQGFLLGLGEPEIIRKSIAHHNKLEIPEGLTPRIRFFTMLIRDADKLDIFKVVTDYYGRQNAAPNNTITWEMPESKVVSPETADQALKGEPIARRNIKSQVDIKIMQLTWVFDLNFKPSIEILEEKGYLEMIYKFLPKDETVNAIYNEVKHNVRVKMNEFL